MVTFVLGGGSPILVNYSTISHVWLGLITFKLIGLASIDSLGTE